MHAHVYTGVCPLTVPADETSSRSGVTTIVSAGDAGAHTIEGFRHLIVNASRTRVLAFVHISTIGLAGWPEGESVDLAYLNVEKAVRAAIENADIVVGIKVREQGFIVGDNGLEPVRRAVEAGERTGLPVMVHIGGAPAPLAEIFEILRPGDIVTHCYTPAGNGLVENSRLIDAAGPARAKGIIFDSGHGFGSFDYATAEVAFEAGFWPDTISTDLHSLSASGPVGDLATTMSKFLNLGMPLQEVIRAATSRPAEVIQRQDTIGALPRRRGRRHHCARPRRRRIRVQGLVRRATHGLPAHCRVGHDSRRHAVGRAAAASGAHDVCAASRFGRADRTFVPPLTRRLFRCSSQSSLDHPDLQALEAVERRVLWLATASSTTPTACRPAARA